MFQAVWRFEIYIRTVTASDIAVLTFVVVLHLLNYLNYLNYLNDIFY